MEFILEQGIAQGQCDCSTTCSQGKTNWCSRAVCYTSSKCIAIFNIKICYYIVLFIPISSKLEFFAMQNLECKLFPAIVVVY